MPRGKKTATNHKKLEALRQTVAGGKNQKEVAKKLQVAPETIRKWESEIIPDGSGLPARRNYEKLSVTDLEREFDHKKAVAKMYIVDRIIVRAPMENDLAKLSGALRDLNNIMDELKDEEKGRGGWSEYVQKAIKEASRKNPVINIENQQVNNYGKDKD